jgi:hypothetical protein
LLSSAEFELSFEPKTQNYFKNLVVVDTTESVVFRSLVPKATVCGISELKKPSGNCVHRRRKRDPLSVRTVARSVPSLSLLIRSPKAVEPKRFLPNRQKLSLTISII